MDQCGLSNQQCSMWEFVLHVLVFTAVYALHPWYIAPTSTPLVPGEEDCQYMYVSMLLQVVVSCKFFLQNLHVLHLVQEWSLKCLVAVVKYTIIVYLFSMCLLSHITGRNVIPFISFGSSGSSIVRNGEAGFFHPSIRVGPVTHTGTAYVSGYIIMWPTCLYIYMYML